MNALINSPAQLGNAILVRQTAHGDDFDVLTQIYEPNINMAVWQRSLGQELLSDVNGILGTDPTLQLAMVLSPQDAYATLMQALRLAPSAEAICADIAQLVDMFCCLFDLEQAGLRLAALGSAMCPRFHVDRVPCRLVTTYHGVATEWLPHHAADRTKLGTGNQGKPDELSGLYSNATDIQQLASGDVALLKGELWQDNEGAGLIHRSPGITSGEQRLLLTLDYINQ